MSTDPETKRYLAIVAEVHTEWAKANPAIRFAPEEHPARSDYNVETLEVEASGEQMDGYERLLVERLTEAGLAHRWKPSWTRVPAT